MKTNDLSSIDHPDSEEIRKLTARKLRLETVKLHAEATKLRAEARNSKPLFSFIKYAFAGLVAGASCYLLFTKVMSDLYDMTSSQRKEAQSQLAEAKTATALLIQQQEVLKKNQTLMEQEQKKMEAQLKATELDKLDLTEKNKSMTDELVKHTALITEMREEVNKRIEGEELSNAEKARLQEKEKSLTQALDNAEMSIPRRANDTLGYLRIGQLDPGGYFISGKSAIGGNPKLDDLLIGGEYEVESETYRVRVSLPRNDTLYHEGVAQVSRLVPGERFILTEGPTVYFREDDRDVWVGIKKGVVQSALPSANPPAQHEIPPTTAPSMGASQ